MFRADLDTLRSQIATSFLPHRLLHVDSYLIIETHNGDVIITTCALFAEKVARQFGITGPHVGYMFV